MIRSFLQNLLLFLIDISCRAYVQLNLYPIRMQVITQEQRPNPPERERAEKEEEQEAEPENLRNPKSLSYVAWLDELYKNSPSTGET